MIDAVLTSRQARLFLLQKQGLIGRRRFSGRQGVLDYIGGTGGIQFDPVDICGRNADLILQARVSGYRKEMLERLLYRDRLLVDYFDKCLCILPVETWPHFARTRARYARSHWGAEEVERHRDALLELIARQGPTSSAEAELPGSLNWHWGKPTRLSRALLESLYARGELVVARKKGTNKYYDLPERHLPPELLHAEEPYPDDLDHLCWRIERRIGAVGLLWERGSDALMTIGELTATTRRAAFDRLREQGRILEVEVQGLDRTLYARAGDAPLLDWARKNPRPSPRMELLAPLDCLLWDRRLIEALFGFSYKWEVYTPKEQRVYGHYVLPLLWGERFVGRCEPVCDRAAGRLELRGLWLEPGRQADPSFCAALDDCLRRFAAFNSCGEVVWCIPHPTDSDEFRPAEPI